MQVFLKILTVFVFAFVSACPDPCLVGGQGTPCGQNPDAIVADCGFYVHCISPNDDRNSYCSMTCDADNPCPLGTYCNGDDQCVSR